MCSPEHNRDEGGVGEFSRQATSGSYIKVDLVYLFITLASLQRTAL